MRIYHGTDANSVDDILEQGLRPRIATGKTNWSDRDFPSIENHVYLTDKFAPYFGIAASDGTEIAVIEIDIDKLSDHNLYPDEDFIEQGLRHPNINIETPEHLELNSEETVERTQSIRDNIEYFQPYWKLSLEMLGNISHQGRIPPEAISRVSVADLPSEMTLTMDIAMSIQGVQVAGRKHELYTRLVMGEEVDEDEYRAAMLGIPDEVPLEDVELGETAADLDEVVGIEHDSLIEQDNITIIENSAYTEDA